MDWPKLILDVLHARRLSGEEKRVVLAIVAMISPHSKGALTQSEIGEAVGMTQPSVSATVASLAEKHFLTKRDAKRGRHKVYGLGERLKKFMTTGNDDVDIVEHELTLDGRYRITVKKLVA